MTDKFDVIQTFGPRRILSVILGLRNAYRPIILTKTKIMTPNLRIYFVNDLFSEFSKPITWFSRYLDVHHHIIYSHGFVVNHNKISRNNKHIAHILNCAKVVLAYKRRFLFMFAACSETCNHLNSLVCACIFIVSFCLLYIKKELGENGAGKNAQRTLSSIGLDESFQVFAICKLLIATTTLSFFCLCAFNLLALFHCRVRSLCVCVCAGCCEKSAICKFSFTNNLMCN